MDDNIDEGVEKFKCDLAIQMLRGENDIVGRLDMTIVTDLRLKRENKLF
jgi:hypothetical protein